MEHVTLEMYLMGRDQTHSSEYTDEIKQNAIKLLKSVNSFLDELEYIRKIEVSSGWRPPIINSKVANAAKKSLHMTGSAIDISDPDGALKAVIEANKGLLSKHGLWLEDPSFTKGWIHLDNKQRSARQFNVFKP